MELVKKDLVDLLNSLQTREKFTYHDGKFDLADHLAEPGLINSGKDNHVKDDSKLETIELLVKELRELENKKKVETKKESMDYKKSMKKMENVFLEAFKKEIEKKKNLKFQRDESTVKKSSIRDKLLSLMGKLDEQIKEEKARVAADEKQISQLEEHDVKQSSSKKSLENELDDILNEHERSTRSDWATDQETVEALKGFNVEQHVPGESSRP